MTLYTYTSTIRKLGIYFAERRSSYADLTTALRKARIPLPVDKYLARSVFISALVAVAVLLSSCLIAIPLSSTFGPMIFLFTFPVSLVFGGITYSLGT